MWDKIKSSIEQHFIIWWTLSCFAVAVSGVIYMAIHFQQNHENTTRYLFLWVLVWALITPLGILAGIFWWLTEVTRMNGDPDVVMPMQGENEGFNDAEEIEHFKVDTSENVNAINICHEDGSVTGEHFV